MRFIERFNMNVKKAKKVRKMAEFDTSKKRAYIRDPKTKTIRVADTDERRHYQDLKKLVKSGEVQV